MTPASIPDALPAQTKRFLTDFVEVARNALGDTLLSVVLFGSAAEGRLRSTSDVNVLVLLRTFDPTRLAGLRTTLTAAEATIRLRAMFLLEDELAAASELFAMKFADIAKRHVVLLGGDPFATLQIPRESEVLRLRQFLLNQTLRLRQTLASQGGHEERLAVALAEAAGALRVSAQTLLMLEGREAGTPKEAFATVALESSAPPALAETLSLARELGALGPGRAPVAVAQVLDLLAVLRTRAERL